MVKYSAQAAAEEQRFIPAVLDTFGKHGPGLGKLVGLLKDVCGESNTVPDLCLQLKQRVAVALHTGNSIAIAKGLSHAQWTRPLADMADAKSRALVLNAWPSLHPQPLRLLAHFPLSRHHRLRHLLRSKPSNLHGPPAFSRATQSQQHSSATTSPSGKAPSADDNHGMDLFSSMVKRQLDRRSLY